MLTRFFLCLFTLIAFNFSFNSLAHAHAGVDHGDNCFLDIGGMQLRLGGFQAVDKIGGGKHFCHIFPATGTVIFTFDTLQDEYLDNKKLNLRLLATNSYSDILFNSDKAFQKVLAHTKDSLSIQYIFPHAGLYALDVELQTNELEPSANNKQRFLFLVGFPIIKSLVFIALGFLLILITTLIRQSLSARSEKNK